MVGRELLINRGTPRNAEEVSGGGGGGRKEGRTGWESVFRPNFSMKNKLAGAINPRIDRAKLLPLPTFPSPYIEFLGLEFPAPNFYITSKWQWITERNENRPSLVSFQIR